MLSVQQLLDQKPKGIFSVAPTDPVLTAIKKMAEHHVGALLVMNGDKLVGIISERDYARKVVLLGRSSEETRVEAIMTSRVITVTAKQDAHDCMRLMTDMRIRHLPVVVRRARDRRVVDRRPGARRHRRAGTHDRGPGDLHPQLDCRRSWLAACARSAR